MLDDIFRYTRRNRELFLNLINSLSIEQLNKIPEGFNNNIAWNFGHIVVTAQALCYTRSAVKPEQNISYLTKYQKGSKPEEYITEAEISELKKLMFTTTNEIEEDVKQNVFTNIKPFSTVTYGYEVNSIEEILTCSLAHDAMHYGIALTQRKLVL